jgi:hypothetical protein
MAGGAGGFIDGFAVGSQAVTGRYQQACCNGSADEFDSHYFSQMKRMRIANRCNANDNVTRFAIAGQQLTCQSGMP